MFLAQNNPLIIKTRFETEKLKRMDQTNKQICLLFQTLLREREIAMNCGGVRQRIIELSHAILRM